MIPKLVLIRGLPGSGKSTMAKNMNGYVHLEADMFLFVDGAYKYDVKKVPGAHDQCVSKTKEALCAGQSVVVSNTFAQEWELQRYTDLGFTFEIIEAEGKWQNVHGVSDVIIEIMKSRWQAIPDKWKKKTPQLA